MGNAIDRHDATRGQPVQVHSATLSAFLNALKETEQSPCSLPSPPTKQRNFQHRSLVTSPATTTLSYTPHGQRDSLSSPWFQRLGFKSPTALTTRVPACYAVEANSSSARSFDMLRTTSSRARSTSPSPFELRPTMPLARSVRNKSCTCLRRLSVSLFLEHVVEGEVRCNIRRIHELPEVSEWWV